VNLLAKQSTVENSLKAILKGFPDGVSIQQIYAKYDTEISKRTLGRWLNSLQQAGIVSVTGKGKATLYHLQESTNTLSQSKSVSVIPLSPNAQKLQELIKTPHEERLPKAYDIDFLKGYRPNSSFYLTKEERSRLREIGQTAQQDQPAGTYARQIMQRLLIDLSWNSSRLEGNTYTLLDTQRLLSKGQQADHKSAADTQMILNHKDAIEFLVDLAQDIDFNRYTITSLHALLSNNLLSDPAASGRLRNFPVGIGRSAFTPLSIPQQIEEYFDLMLDKARQIEDPFEQAFFIMVQLPYLQPFEDVNKRVSRLAANIPLNKLNLAPLSFIDVPQDLYVQGLLVVYEFTRVDLLKDVFLWAYERSAKRYAQVRQTLGEPDPFRMKYRDEIRNLIAEVVNNGWGQAEVQGQIVDYAKQLPETDQARFIEVVEMELLSLHEGNFARYRILPSKFAIWQRIWKG
jgi:hypothetical protein